METGTGTATGINNIRIITYVTSDYYQDTNLLVDSLAKAGIKLSIFRIYNAKAIIRKNEIDDTPEETRSKLWNVNCNHKPFIIKTALDIFDEPIIWYTDWDSVLMDAERLIDQSNEWYEEDTFDIGLNHRFAGTKRAHFNGGSIFIRNCDRSRAFLTEWMRLVEYEYLGENENNILNLFATKIYQSDNETPARIGAMPFAYCRIDPGHNDNENGIEPVWLHRQFSRKYNVGNPYYKTRNESVMTRDEKAIQKTEGNLKEIFQSDFTIDKNSVTIVGTAGSGKDLWHLIPDESYKIALNAAITIPGVEFDAWCCIDPFIPGKDYFDEYFEKFKGVKLFKFQPDKDIDYLKRMWQEQGLLVHESINTTYPEYPQTGDNLYLLNCLYSFEDKERPPIKGQLRNGATVAGFALQIAWYYGIKKVYFHGVEMAGNRYSVEDPSVFHAENEIWDNVRVMNTFVNRIKLDGVDIISLTKTHIAGVVKSYE